MSYKASDIGDVPSHWTVAELQDFLKRITYGFTNPMSDAEDGPWKITAKDVVDGYVNYSTARKTTKGEFENKLTDKSRPNVGDVLLTKDGSIGRVAVVDRSGICINQSVALLQPNDQIDPYFLKYLLLTPYYQRVMVNDADGSTIKHIYITRVDKMEVAVPPLPEQKDIIGVIKTLDDKIQLNHQISRTLEQMARAIFKSWFVDFEPVKAKIAARERWQARQSAQQPASPVCYAAELEPEYVEPELETHMALAAMQAISGKTEAQLTRLQTEHPDHYAELRAIADLFPTAMQESELGKIPEGWEVLPLSEMVELMGGGTPKKSEPSFWNGDIHWFSVKDAPAEGNVFVVETANKITDEGLKRSSTKMLPIGTTIVTARGTVGKLALTGVSTAMNQSCYGVIGSDGTGPYLNYLRLQLAVETLKRNTHGAVFDTITRGTFETVKQPQPCLSARQRFEEAVQPLFEQIRANLLESKTLSEMRDLLLPKLLSGEIIVPDAENQLADARVTAHV